MPKNLPNHNSKLNTIQLQRCGLKNHRLFPFLFWDILNVDMKNSFAACALLLIVIDLLIAAEYCNESLQKNVRHLRTKQRTASHTIHKSFEECNNNNLYFSKNITFTIFTRGIYCISLKNSKLNNALFFAKKLQLDNAPLSPLSLSFFLLSRFGSYPSNPYPMDVSSRN